jgi:hypothetical protein
MQLKKILVLFISITLCLSSQATFIPLTVQEIDGSPSVSKVKNITFNGATLTDLLNGRVLVTVSTAATAAGSTGAIQFNNSNALAADTSNLFWDDTNNRLGIGTTSPSQKLQIYHPTDDNLLFIESGDPGAFIQTKDNVSNAFFGNVANTAFMGFNIGLSPGNLNVTSTGNVGIGTTSPAQKLDVNGDINARSGYYYGGTFSPMNLELTRTLANTANATVNLGSVIVIHGGHNLRIALTASENSFSVAKTYLIPIQYAGIPSTWTTVIPIYDTGSYVGNNFQLDVNGSNDQAHFRIRREGGMNVGTIYARIESVGPSILQFTENGSVGIASSKPTQIYGSLRTDLSTGKVGLGTMTPNEMFTVANPGPVNALAIKEGSRPSSTSSFGKLYVNGSTSNLMFLDDTGTQYDITTSNSGGGSGDVVGPASATDNSIARFDSTTGKLIQNSGATIDDAGLLTVQPSTAPSAEAFRINSRNEASSYNTKFYMRNSPSISDFQINTSSGGMNADIIRAGRFSGNGVGVLIRDSLYVTPDTHAVQIVSPAANRVPLMIQAASSQSANLMEWKNSSLTTLSVISNGGSLGIGITSPARKLHISQAMRLEPLSGSQPTSPSMGDIYMDGDTGSLCLYDGSTWSPLGGGTNTCN